MRREVGTASGASAGAARLPADISRCAGANLTGPACEKRETCRRYLERQIGTHEAPAWEWYIHPQIPGPCIYHLPAEAAQRSLSESPSEGSQS